LTIHEKGIQHTEIVWSRRIGIRVGTEHPWRATVKGHQSVSGKRVLGLDPLNQ
jgi:3-methyladenine DNA glycosylase Mpg